ncbi:MAG: M48 family metalloprotease [Candidatus Bathyarchaeota archaeon]|nr:M48 family metalloprotease [Candidatus Bathyarchaeota archaeon A05DMB-5]MDH7557097.1 M48 family metalloprotease [Candidatus Bathyarchaeota archaeon]
MGRLAELKLAMGTSIFLVALIFAMFLSAIMFILNFPLIYAVIGTMLFILLEYLIGPAIVASSTRLRYLKDGENPWLESTVKELAEKSGIPMPKLAVVPENTPNAFVFGRTAKGATLAVHEGLLTKLTQEEIKGVIGHELGHIKHKDYIVMTVLSAIPLLAYLIARGTWEVARLSGSSSKKKEEGSIKAAFIAAAIVSYIVYIISLLCVMRLSRLREHYADAYSAYLTGSPRSLQSALAKITYGLSLSSKPPSGARAFYIGDPAMAREEVGIVMEKKEEYDLDKDGVLDERELELAMEKEAKSAWARINTWFATHPPTFRRILLLREIEEEMQSGRFTSDRIYAKI